MTISVAAAYVNNDGGSSVTSGNFSIASGDLIVVVANCDEGNDANNTTWTLSDSRTPDLAYTLIQERDGSDGDGGGVIAWHHLSSTTDGTYNVTVAVSGSVSSDSPAVKVYKLASTDFDSADIVGASTENNLTTDPQTTAGITPETSGIGIAAWTDWNQTGTPTSSDLTMTGFNTTGDISGGSGYKTLTSGVSATANINSGGAPSGNYIWFEIRAGAGGSGALTGATTVTFSPAGVLTGAGALTGAATVTFSPTALIRGNAPITGATTVTFSPSATLLGIGALTGASTATFSPTATLTGAGALEGGTTLTFSPTAELVGSGALTGSATVTFTASGALDVPEGALSGSATTTFSVVGVLTGTGDLSGSTTLTFSPSGTLSDASAPVVETPETNAGGWAFYLRYEQERDRRRKKRREQEEAEEAVQELPPVEKEIAQFLHKQERIDESKKELERLKGLVTEFREIPLLSEKASEALEKARLRGLRSDLAKLDKELKRMLEDEEMAVLMLLLND
jgi:hypothetical protein